MDKRGIIITILAVVSIHALVLVLALLPGCAGSTTRSDAIQTESHKESGAGTSPAADLFFTGSNTPAPAAAEPQHKSGPAAAPRAVRTPRVPLAKQPRPVSSANAVDGRILDLKIWHKKNPRNVNRVCGILVDLNSRKVLWQLNPTKVVPIASLSKIMSLIVAYEILQDPRCPIDLDTEIEITPEARKVPPSGVMFKPDEKSFPLRKLMMSMAVKSANDSTYLIAQTFGNGSADEFVRLMNAKAKKLGMKNTTFHNPHGLPGKEEGKPDNTSTARDLLILCEVYLQYPQLCEWSAKRTADFRGESDLISHNHLLKGGKHHVPGVTGIKTGFTNNAGTCIAVICERDNRRLLAILTGFNSPADRDRFAKSLIEWGYKQK